jgi:hypothetical protein
MKKLLLAAAILVLSATAMATNTSVALDTAVSETLTVTAHYVTPIAVTLDTVSIDFGDVYTDSIISTEPVVATVTGEESETFTYSVASNGGESSVVLLTGNILGETQPLTAGTNILTFNVGLDTAKVTSADVSEIVTISVNYDAIADTAVVKS